MPMQLRSGRRLASPPVPAPRGDLRRVRPRHSGDYDGKDLISDLPKDMRLEVLARLPCTREAIRTSVLSEPWRRLWTELRDLNLTLDDDVGDLDSLLGTLAQVQPKLNRLCIKITNGKLGGTSISSLLDAADKLEPLELFARLRTEHGSAPFVLPCFARATSIELRIRRLLFTLPPTGSFTSLEKLTLFGSRFVDPGLLLPRCPRLRSLHMDGRCPESVRALAIESSSLGELIWVMKDIKQPVDIHIVAPNLKTFVFWCYSRKFTMSLSAPKLEELHLKCYYIKDSTVGCAGNESWRLRKLELIMGPSIWLVWPSDGDGQQHRHVLSLHIRNVMVIAPVERSIQQEVARLPVTLTHFSTLELHLKTDGHVFGALVLQLLRMRTTIQRLNVILPEKDDAGCWEHCDCDFDNNWRNELIYLPRLEVAHFEGFRGHDHEMDFLKLIFESAPSLKTMAVQHFNEVSIVRGACEKLHNMFSSNASVKFSFS